MRDVLENMALWVCDVKFPFDAYPIVRYYQCDMYTVLWMQFADKGNISIFGAFL